MGYQNFYATKLTNDIGAADTSIVVDQAPTATSGRLVLEARNPTQREIIKYTGVAGNTLTGVTRGQGGTTAKSHLKSSLVEMNATGEDLQDLYDAFNSFAAANINGWVTAANLPTSIVAQGNRNYLATFNGIDLTNIYSEGMRLRGTRTVPAPTRAAVFNGTNQSLTKATPNKMTFTDNFTLRATIKMSNLNLTASNMYIMGRGDATSNQFWGLYVAPTGQFGIACTSTAGNNKLVASIRAIPWDEEVKIAATWTGGTVVLYMDGVVIDTITTTAGTPPTNNVAQVGDFAIGRLGANTGNTWFPGQISQVAVYDAVLTAAQIRAADSAGVVGNEANLKSAYSLDNVITDLNTTSPNDLTNNNAVTFTTGGGFGNRGVSSTLEYGVIVTKPTFSGGNTSFYFQVPEGCMFPVAGTPLSAISYSAAGKPYNFPNDKTRWDIKSILRGGRTGAFGAINQWFSSSFAIYLPIGSWDIKFEGVAILTSTVSGARNGLVTISDGGTLFPLPTGAAGAPKTLAKRIYAPGATDALDEIVITLQQAFATAVILYVYLQIFSATGSETWSLDAQGGDVKFVASNQWI